MRCKEDETERLCGLLQWWLHSDCNMTLYEILEFIGEQEDHGLSWKILADIACE